MDILTFLRIAARRWVVTVPLAVLTVIAGAALVARSEPMYKAEGSSLLLPPAVQPSTDPNSPNQIGNPYLDSNAGMSVTAAALVRAASQPDVRAQQQAAGHSPTYDIDLDEKAPILTITDTVATRDGAIDSVVATQALMRQMLTDRENAANVPPELRITMDDLVVPEGAGEQTGSQVRLAAGVGVLGLAAIVAGALIAENWATRRRRRYAHVGPATEVASANDDLDIAGGTTAPRRSEEVPVGSNGGSGAYQNGDQTENGGSERGRRRRHAYAGKRDRRDD